MKTWYKNKAFYVKKSEKSKKWIFFEVEHEPHSKMLDLHILPCEVLREAEVIAFPTKRLAEEQAYKQVNKTVNEYITRTRKNTQKSN